MFSKFLSPNLAAAFGLFVLSIVTFGNALHGSFLLDDYDLVTNNLAPGSNKLANLYSHFIPGQQATLGLEKSSHAAYYRPFAHILPHAQYLIFENAPFGYHVSNLILFFLACFCCYLLFCQLAGNKLFAFLCSALFCLHPLNGLMVNYITASVYALQLIFLTMSVLFYIRWESSRSQRRISDLCISLLSFVLSLMCHETSIMIPAYLFLISWYRDRTFIANCKKIAPFAMILFLYFVFRIYFSSLQASVFSKAGNYPDLNFLNYTATFLKLIEWYLKKFLTLESAVIIWSTPVVKDFLWGWLMSGVLFVGATVFLIHKWKNDQRSFFIVWFLVGLLPLTLGCMFLPQTGFMIEPHWLFFASFGLFALGTHIFLSVTKKMSAGIKIGSLVIVMCALLFASWNNNDLWRDELVFSRHWVEEAPTNKNAIFFWAQALSNSGRNAQAKTLFQKALTNEKSDWQIYTNLAAIATRENNEDLALRYLNRALVIFPESPTVNNNLGIYYLQKKDFERAEQYFKKASNLNPYQLEPLLNLGIICEQKEKWEQAWELYARVYDLRPNDERVLFALLRLDLENHGRSKISLSSEQVLNKVHSMILLNGLGGLFAVKGQTMVSIKYFIKSLALYPQQVIAYQDLGKVLANNGQWQQALNVWHEGLKVNPQDPIILDLLAQSKQILKQ